MRGGKIGTETEKEQLLYYQELYLPHRERQHCQPGPSLRGAFHMFMAALESLLPALDHVKGTNEGDLVFNLIQPTHSPCPNKDYSSGKPLFPSITWAQPWWLLFTQRLPFKVALSETKELQSTLKKTLKNSKKDRMSWPCSHHNKLNWIVMGPSETKACAFTN